MSTIVEKVHGRGHKNISATHPTTLAITRDAEVRKSGDCFLLVSADKSPRMLSDAFKNAARKPVKIIVKIIAGDLVDEFYCYGDPALTFRDDFTMVFRKSKYICDKTVGIRSNKSAVDIDRRIVERLREGCEATIELIIGL
ncbi:MAG: DUF371 domain-containing protein [Crenarchaeota archaeon]|nr:DUF371 domain-containing protein [Thermoproteota archaeon]MDW8033356.1 DUF371 domain-containing protein [Nitrososphaerota archaeon]